MGLFDFSKKKKNDETVNQSIKIEETAKQTTPFAESSTPNSDNNFYMIVEDVFSLKGAGTLVTGIVQGGSIQTGNTVYLLKNNGDTITTKVKGIEVLRKIVDKVEAGNSAGLLFSEIDKKDINKGDMVSATNKSIKI